MKDCWLQIKQNYSGTTDLFCRYWQAYGGIRSLLASPYLHCSLLFVLITGEFWLKPDWWDVPLSVLPNVIGFSLGGYAILLSFGTDNFRKLLVSTKVQTTNAYVEVSAAFAHFIVVQIVALMLAVLAKACYQLPPTVLLNLSRSFGAEFDGILFLLQVVTWTTGGLAFVYAMACAVAATMRVFRLSTTFSKKEETEVFKQDPPQQTSGQ